MKPITLSTKRLILRRAHEKDPENLFRNYFSNPYSARFLTRKPHIHIDQTRKFLNEWCNEPWDSECKRFAWVIALANTNESVGVFLVELENNNTAQLHYGIGCDFIRQGLMTEAGHEVIQWLVCQTGLQKIWAMCDLSNIGSRKVLEKWDFQYKEILENKLILPAFDGSPRDCSLYEYPMHCN
jgi:ribosomal-protein-alanine N-acetyltransferase